MTADEGRKQPTITRTTERGYFIRKKTRRGKKKRQKTTIVKTNDKKVTLGKIGDLEFYVYPYDFPDSVFIGIFPMSTQLEMNDVNKLTGLANRLRWYLNGEWQTDPNWRKGANSRKRAVAKAYNTGLNELKERRKG